MIETVFAASLAATIAIVVYLRVARPPERRQLFHRGLLELAVPLTVTSGVFVVLQWRVRSAVDGIGAVTSIREIESAIRTVRNAYIERLVIPAWAQLLILGAILIAGAMWPNLRAARPVERFRTSMRWMTRVQIAATLLASFTFFGAVQATSANAAEVRLAANITAIERAYDDAFAAADEALATSAAAQLLADPVWTPAFGELSEALANQQTADAEIAAARASLAGEKDSPLREFRVRAEETRPAVERLPFVQRPRVETAGRRDTWTQAEANQLAADADALRRQAAAALVNAAADAGREAVAKRLVAEFFAGSVAEGLATVVLDASVLYDFRHHVADASASVVERVLRRGERLRDAFSSVLPRLRAAVTPLAPAAAQTAQTIYRERAAASAQTLAAARQVRSGTLAEYRAAANQQAAQEQEALVARATEKLGGRLALEAVWLIERLVERPGEPAMQRISRIHNLSAELRIGSLPVLAYKERQLGGGTRFNDALDREVESLLRTERYEMPFFNRMDVLDSIETETEWERYKRAFVLSKLEQGAVTISASEWHHARAQFRAPSATPGAPGPGRPGRPKPRPIPRPIRGR